MMMTIDEAIKHCEEVAKKKEKECKWISGSEDAGMNGALAKTYAECAKEHRQLAKWLTELKAYKGERVGCEYCKDRYRERHERPCSLCKRNFVDMFEREVNADE